MRSGCWLEDADIFVVFGVFGENGDEVVFQGAVEPDAPIAQGWLRSVRNRHRCLHFSGDDH